MQYNKYLPIAPEFEDMLHEQSEMKGQWKVFFFDPEMELKVSKGQYQEMIKTEKGEYLSLLNKDKIRLDRIITVNGKPGPAYDEYNAFADACLSCQAGYDDV